MLIFKQNKKKLKCVHFKVCEYSLASYMMWCLNQFLAIIFRSISFYWIKNKTMKAED